MSKRIAARVRLDVWDKEVVLTLNRDAYVAIVKRYRGETEADDGKDGAHGRSVYLDNGRPAIVGWFTSDLSTLVHECVHIAAAVLHDRGVPLAIENDEALAYTVDCLFAAFYKRARRRAIR